MKSLASAAAAAEITRLTEALQRSEAERDALIAGGGDVLRRGERRGLEVVEGMERMLDVDRTEATVQRITRERDAAVMEVLFSSHGGRKRCCCFECVCVYVCLVCVHVLVVFLVSGVRCLGIVGTRYA